MKKLYILLGALALLALVQSPVVSAMGSHAQKESLGTRYETSSLTGADVKNPAGEMLGTLHDFVIDREGRVVFAVLSHEGKEVAVPFTALTISGMKPEDTKVILNADMAKIEAAPAFDRTKATGDRDWATEVYRYFGQQPYWTTEEVMHPAPATPMGSGGVSY